MRFLGETDGRLAEQKALLADSWGTRFVHVGPVREFPSYPGRRGFSGLWWSSTMRDLVGFESWLERDRVMLLDFSPEVVAFSSQPFWLTWPAGAKRRRHAPDFFARLADGTGLVIDVRADDDMEAAGSVGDPIAVLPSAFHMLWSGQLQADLAGGPLGGSTLVAAAGESR